MSEITRPGYAQLSPTCGTMVPDGGRGGDWEGRMARVLIVDDLAPSRSLIRAIVRLDGHAAVEAGSGAEALATLAREPIDLVIVDLVMAGMDGYTMLEQMRQLPGRSQTPVIAVSDADESVDLLRAAELGALDHLSKPFGYDNMARAIKRLIEASPEELASLRVNRKEAAAEFHTVIDLVDEANTQPKRRLFRRARSSTR
jgi:CheY-like chemotaxis protein